MIKKQTPLGTMVITPNFFLHLVSEAIKDCYGVAGMADIDTLQSIQTFIMRKPHSNRGVKVVGVGDSLVIDLHIVVLYGMNISAIVKSIVHRVKYSVEQVTGFHVSKINVYVDGVLPE